MNLQAHTYIHISSGVQLLESTSLQMRKWSPLVQDRMSELIIYNIIISYVLCYRDIICEICPVNEHN
jgi:hypothetical protein